MKTNLASQFEQLQKLVRANASKASITSGDDYVKYKYDPIGFIENELKVILTPQQKEVCDALMEPPHRLLVRSGHSIGKTLICGCLIDWFTCTRDPGICIVTAPVQRQLVDCTFKEIRYHMPSHLKQYFYPKATMWYHHERHKITGYTAIDTSSFQGIHEENIFCVVDEMTGIAQEIIEAIRGICSGGNAFVLMCGNPTDTSSGAYLEEMSGLWNVREMSALDHPNILAELKGDPPVIPSAVRLENLRMNMKSWFDEVTLEDHETSEAGFTDIFFDGKILRPNPDGDSRVLGRYPQLSAYSIFSEADIRTAINSKMVWAEEQPYEMGLDYARFGDDMSVITVRRGLVVVHMEDWSHADTSKIAKRLKDMCKEYSAKMHGTVMPYQIRVRIDDTGCGGGVVDQRENYNFIPVNSATVACSESDYPNKRSELLFNLRDKMRAGLSFRGLSSDQIMELRRQMTTILYKLDNRARRVAEPKSDTKKRILRSPDNLDSLALAMYDYTSSWSYKEIDFKHEIDFDRFSNVNHPLLGGGEKDRKRDRGWNS